MSSSATRQARALRRRETDAERLLWRHLRSRQLGVKFRRQHPLAGYVLDFYSEELRLAVELDGGQHEVAPERDEARTAALEKLGIEVARFWNNDLLRNTEGVLQRLSEIIEQRRQLNPLPPGRVARRFARCERSERVRGSARHRFAARADRRRRPSPSRYAGPSLSPWEREKWAQGVVRCLSEIIEQKRQANPLPWERESAATPAP